MCRFAWQPDLAYVSCLLKQAFLTIPSLTLSFFTSFKSAASLSVIDFLRHPLTLDDVKLNRLEAKEGVGGCGPVTCLLLPACFDAHIANEEKYPLNWETQNNRTVPLEFRIDAL